MFPDMAEHATYRKRVRVRLTQAMIRGVRREREWFARQNNFRFAETCNARETSTQVSWETEKEGRRDGVAGRWGRRGGSSMDKVPRVQWKKARTLRFWEMG